MKFLLVLLILGSTAFAVEKAENVKTKILSVTSDDDGNDKLEVPHRIPDLIWDQNSIKLVRRGFGSQQKFFVKLKGSISKHKVDSFTYQVDGYDAHKIVLNKEKFDLDVPLEKSPAVIRLWLEVTEGRGVHIYSDEVHVRSDIVPGAAEDKQINY